MTSSPGDLQSDPRVGPGSLVEQYFEAVYSLSLRILGNPQDAEDATQECFLQLLRDPTTLRRARSSRAWVLTVARNTAISLQRSLQRSRRRVRRQAQEPEDSSPPPLEDPVDTQGLFVAFAALSEEDRHLLQMRFLEGMGLAEMAREVDKNPGAIGTALWRALKRLRHAYDEEKRP